ncbi:hypothetical protein KZZ07_25230 [Mameliella sp. CS4]|uniref:hypothetical protein n=1 Tax=Mameliella sp. CS4 TaxID=2862329 RepID=UPI001C5D303C|nr:hypothetical protein [Mameliella sp. CS4]MBW4985850.1 hypothetical protein [Mameliella sp. CS4]
MTETTTRKSFSCTSDGEALLAWLREVCDLQSDADVLRHAFSTLADLVAATGNGDEVIIRSADGHERVYSPVCSGGDVTPEELRRMLHSVRG